MRITKLTHKHQTLIDEFCCGNDILDDYLYNESLFDCDSVTHIVLDNDKCVGFCSLSCGAIYMDDNYKIHTFPAVEIKYFAVDKEYQGKVLSDDYGSFTFANAILNKIVFNVIYDFTENICGASRVILYSTPRAVNFYKNFGFKIFDNSFLIDESSYLDECVPMIYNYD